MFGFDMPVASSLLCFLIPLLAIRQERVVTPSYTFVPAAGWTVGTVGTGNQIRITKGNSQMYLGYSTGANRREDTIKIYWEDWVTRTAEDPKETLKLGTVNATILRGRSNRNQNLICVCFELDGKAMYARMFEPIGGDFKTTSSEVVKMVESIESVKAKPKDKPKVDPPKPAEKPAELYSCDTIAIRDLISKLNAETPLDPNAKAKIVGDILRHAGFSIWGSPDLPPIGKSQGLAFTQGEVMAIAQSYSSSQWTTYGALRDGISDLAVSFGFPSISKNIDYWLRKGSGSVNYKTSVPATVMYQLAMYHANSGDPEFKDDSALDSIQGAVILRIITERLRSTSKRVKLEQLFAGIGYQDRSSSRVTEPDDELAPIPVKPTRPSDIEPDELVAINENPSVRADFDRLQSLLMDLAIFTFFDNTDVEVLHDGPVKPWKRTTTTTPGETRNLTLKIGTWAHGTKGWLNESGAELQRIANRFSYPQTEATDQLYGPKLAARVDEKKFGGGLSRVAGLLHSAGNDTSVRAQRPVWLGVDGYGFNLSGMPQKRALTKPVSWNEVVLYPSVKLEPGKGTTVLEVALQTAGIDIPAKDIAPALRKFRNTIVASRMLQVQIQTILDPIENNEVSLSIEANGGRTDDYTIPANRDGVPTRVTSSQVVRRKLSFSGAPMVTMSDGETHEIQGMEGVDGVEFNDFEQRVTIRPDSKKYGDKGFVDVSKATTKLDTSDPTKMFGVNSNLFFKWKPGDSTLLLKLQYVALAGTQHTQTVNGKLKHTSTEGPGARFDQFLRTNQPKQTDPSGVGEWWKIPVTAQLSPDKKSWIVQGKCVSNLGFRHYTYPITTEDGWDGTIVTNIHFVVPVRK